MQGDAAQTEEGLIKRPQPCWLLAEGCLPSPDLSQHLCSSSLSSHTSFSFLPYNSTASFPQDPKQWDLKSLLSAVKCPGQAQKQRGDHLIPTRTSVISAAVCQTKWSDFMITSGHEDEHWGRWWESIQKACKAFAWRQTWLAILQNFTSRKLPWEILKQQILSSEV